MDQWNDFYAGIAAGLIFSAACYLLHRAWKFGKALDLTEDGTEPFLAMTHNKLWDAAQSERLIVLMDVQAEELCEEFGDKLEELALVQGHLEEALTRKTELHKEINQLARVVNDLQDKLNRSQLETAHCRACCDELRQKLGGTDSATAEALKMKRRRDEGGRPVLSASLTSSSPVPDNSHINSALLFAAIASSDPVAQPVTAPEPTSHSSSTYDSCSSSSSSYDSGSSSSSSSYSSSSCDSGSSGGW